MIRRALATALLLIGLLAVVPAEAGAGVPASTPLERVIQVSAGGAHTCAALAGGQVRCWGTNLDGEAGIGVAGTTSEPAQPVLALTGSGPLTGVTAVAAGSHHTCALTASDQVRCWGANDRGQVGNGRPAARFLRPKVVSAPAGPGRLGDVVQLAAGERHTCALLASGQVRCWGSNASGELGDGTTTDRRRPRVVLNAAGTGPLQNVTDLSAGPGTTCVVLTTSGVRCWGENGENQLGDGTTTDRSLPTTVLYRTGDPLLGITQVAVGAHHGCAVTRNGHGRCWGLNLGGAVGDGTFTNRTMAVIVVNQSAVFRLRDIAGIEVGDELTCAVLTNGAARCWGLNGQGQLGTGGIGGVTGTPSAVRNGADDDFLTGAVAIDLGDGHACVRRFTRQLRCWGANADGQLGDGTSDPNARLPRVVLG